MAQKQGGGRGWLVGLVFTGVVLLSAWLAGVGGGDAPPEAVAEGAAAEPTAAPAETPEPPAQEAPPREPPVPSPPPRAGRRRPVVVQLPSEPPDDKAPLVIGLHGRGDTAANFSRLAPRLSRRMAWRFVEAQQPFSRGFAWFTRSKEGRPEGIAESVERIHLEVQRARGKRPAALFGFSQGCMMILHYLVAHPETVQAAVCVGGSVVGTLSTEVGSSARPPILFVGGAEDPVVPAAATRAAMQRMENLGFPTEHIEHGRGHTVPPEELPRISDWLLAKLGR